MYTRLKCTKMNIDGEHYIYLFVNVLRKYINNEFCGENTMGQIRLATEIFYLVEQHIDIAYQLVVGLNSPQYNINKWILLIQTIYNKILDYEKNFGNGGGCRKYITTYSVEAKYLLEQLRRTKRVLDPYVNNRIDAQPIPEHSYYLRPRTKKVKYV